MASELSRHEYAARYGPTTGDRVRLGDTNLLALIERDETSYGDEVLRGWAARKRGASKGTGSGAGAMTVTELRREAARLGIDGRSKMGKAQLIRAVGQKRRSR